MKKNNRQKQPLEIFQNQQRKKTKQEILDADKHISQYNGNLQNLIGIFSRDNEEEDFTQNYLTTKSQTKLQKIQEMTLDDLKNSPFTFGTKIDFGDFLQGDRISKISSVRRSTLNNKLIATVCWKERPDGTIPKPKEYFTSEVAKHDPQKLIKYYKSKMITTQIFDQKIDC